LIVNDPAAAGVHIMEAENLIKDLRRELTNLIHQLRPVALEGKGLAAALSDYVEDWSRQNGITSEIHVKHKRSLPLEIEQAVFRISQEALANVARHSAARSVEIDLVYTKGAVSCSIRDDGHGFDPGRVRKGVGLRSMGERVNSLGGKLTIESEQGGGTFISFAIPINSLPEVDLEEFHE
jgi:signal transduction histidine kinase